MRYSFTNIDGGAFWSAWLSAVQLT